MRENLTSRRVKSALAGAIGSRILALREERRWSLRALGARLGIETSKLGRYESGEQLPPHLTLVRIADAFGVSLDVLMGLVERDTRIDRLLRELTALEKEDRDAAASVLEGALRRLRYVRDPETSCMEVESR